MDDVIRELVTLADGPDPIECVLRASEGRWQARAYPRGIIAVRYVDRDVDGSEVWDMWVFGQSRPRNAVVNTPVVAGKRLSAEKWIGEWRRYDTIPGDVYDAMADIYH
jgi:hypothetical protein